jgi:hypothetical protein
MLPSRGSDASGRPSSGTTALDIPLARQVGSPTRETHWCEDRLAMRRWTGRKTELRTVSHRCDYKSKEAQMVSATSTASAVRADDGTSAVRPFRVGFPQSELAELRPRVLATR